MADEPYNININANVKAEELQKLIAELNALNVAIGDLNKMTLSGVQKSAETLVTTGMSLTDAIRAQNAAFEEMKKSSDKATDGLKKTGNEIDNIGEKINRKNQIFEGFFLELGAMGARLATQLPAALLGSIEAFGRQEMAVQKLTAAIRANGGNVSEVVPIMREFASEIQRITTYGDEQVLAMQAMASSMGVSSDQMQGVIRSAIGLASALNMDVMTAVKAASAAVQGKTTALQEYIPALAKCKTESEKLAVVQKLSASGFAQARAEAQTATGKLKQCANAWGDLAEVAGGIFAPVATDIAGLLKGMCEVFSENLGIVAALTGSFTSLAVSMAFTKIGGLPNVIALIKLTGGSLMGVKGASDALNASLKANPIGAAISVAITAVTALTAAYSYFKGKADETYKNNIEQSAEYRSALDAEIESLKQWGIGLDDNKKRVAEISAEIEKLEAAQAKFLSSAGMRGHGMGAGMRIYSADEQAQLDNYSAKIEKLAELKNTLADSGKLAELAEKRHAEAVEKSNAILAESEAKTRAAVDGTEALRQIKQKYADTEREIAGIEAAFADGSIMDSERVAKANRLAQARKEILELEKAEAEQVLKNGENAMTAETLKLLSRKMSLETQIVAARNRGDLQTQKRINDSLWLVSQDLRREELARKYITALKDTVQTEEDYLALKKQAYASANTTLEVERKTAIEAAKKATAEKWLANETAVVKSRLQALETDILTARAAGNEKLAKDLEGSQRIAQLAAEIFETTRREGMSRDQLVALQNSANEQAQKRYALEKSISDETERQNLAKNAQAKIEDILLTNKIEQLRAEGKISDAKELERERDIKRALADLKGVSDADKAKLADTMRQTNTYRDRQEFGRNSGGFSSFGGRGGYFNNGGFSGGGTGYSQTTYGGYNGGGIRQSGRRQLAPSRRQGETWAQANARYADEMMAKRQQREQRRADNDTLGAMTSSTERMAFQRQMRENDVRQFRGIGDNASERARKTLGAISADADTMAGIKPRLGGAVAEAVTDSKKLEPRKLGKSGNSDEEKPQQKNETPARKALNNRTANPPQKNADSGGRIVELLESIEKSVRGTTEKDIN